MRSTTRAAPDDLLGPLDPGQEHVELLVVRGSGLLERGQGGAALEDPELRGQFRLRGADVIGRHEGEQQRGLVPPLAGDVLLDVQRGGEQVLGVHAPSLPAAATADTAHPPGRRRLRPVRLVAQADHHAYSSSASSGAGARCRCRSSGTRPSMNRPSALRTRATGRSLVLSSRSSPAARADLHQRVSSGRRQPGDTHPVGTATRRRSGPGAARACPARNDASSPATTARRISVQSRSKGSSRFQLWLPTSQPESSPTARSVMASAPAGPAGPRVPR